MKIIVAADEDGGIGKNGSIPWSCPEDQRFFQMMTIGETVVMGRKTFESLGSKPLRDRNNIVISSVEYKDPDFKLESMNLYNFYDKYQLEENYNECNNVWIIGGSEIYSILLGNMIYVDTIYRSVISGTYNCDRFFHIPERFRLASSMKLSDRCKVEKWVCITD